MAHPNSYECLGKVIVSILTTMKDLRCDPFHHPSMFDADREALADLRMEIPVLTDATIQLFLGGVERGENAELAPDRWELWEEKGRGERLAKLAAVKRKKREDSELSLDALIGGRGREGKKEKGEDEDDDAADND